MQFVRLAYGIPTIHTEYNISHYSKPFMQFTK